MKDLILNIRGLLGIDLSILYTVLARVLQAGGGLIVVGLISFFLTKEEQGYYYTFGSLLAIQVFFELGLTSIITQYVAHEAVNIRWVSATELSGPPESLSRLSSLLSLCLTVFSVFSVLLFGVLIAGGFFFFSTYNVTSTTVVHWQVPWVIISLSTALLLIINPLLAFFEGLGQVKEVAQLRLKQQLLSLIIVIFILSIKGGLYAQGISTLLTFLLLASSIIFSSRKHLLLKIRQQIGPWKVSYRKEIFPYQYKIALSWISGYLIFQLFNPILFATQGAIAAGQMGMTLAALNGVAAISMSWINTKVTLFSSLIAKKNYKELDIVFEKSLRQLITVNAIMLMTFILMIEALQLFNSSLRERFLPLLPLILLCVSTFINQFVFSWATYLRCHKQEPFLAISIINGILTAFSSFILGRYFGVTGIVAGYTVLNTMIGGIGGYYIFITKKKEWHAR